ncbi:MAG: hypothetical protein IIW54_05515 [Lachnospiraceae bacterium]|nr:hypothetical protein [Lachnospiraceae bacterium]
MMKDIKQCFKLLKYGYQFKTSMGCACFFVLLGILFVMPSFGDFVMGTMYIYLGMMFATQPMYMMLFSECVQASPRREKIEIRYVDILNVVSGVVSSAVVIILALLMQHQDMEGISAEAVLVIGGIMVFLLYCYMSMAFKSMVVGSLLFVGLLWVIGIFQAVFDASLSHVLGGNMLLAVVIFLLENVLGIVCGHGIRKLLYRKGMSKLAMGAKLRMEQS